VRYELRFQIISRNSFVFEHNERYGTRAKQTFDFQKQKRKINWKEQKEMEEKHEKCLKVIKYERMDWIKVALDRNQGHCVVSTVTKWI
jgi:hypothetical protein